MPSFGPYELLERLGVGGMGEIFLARLTRQASFEKLLVIKRILPQFSSDVSFRELFCREARLAALLSHQNIVQIFDFGEVEEQSFIAMEFVEGVDGGRLLAERHRLELSLVLTVLEGAARGLDYAHRKRGPDGAELGLVHRDIAPKNLLVSCEGEVKWIDFGLAHLLDGAAKLQGVAGTIAYMSPEQASGRPPDVRSDIFSFGVTAYEMLTGELPFGRSGEADLLEHVEAVRGQEYALPSELVPGLPAELDALLARALEPEPENRYQSIREMSSALELLARQTPPAGHQALGEWVRALLPRDRVCKGVSPTIVSAEPLAGPVLLDVGEESVGSVTTDLVEVSPATDTNAPLAQDNAPEALEPGELPRRSWLWAMGVLLVVALGAAMWARPWWQEERRSSPQETESAGPAEVQLALASTPPGAAVSLDGSYVGETPLELLVPLGEGALELRKLGYEPYVHQLTAQERERGRFEGNIALVAEATTLTFDVAPETASVFVDGALQRSRKVAIEAGSKQIRVSLEGYLEHEEQLTVAAGEQRTLTVALRPLPAVLRVEATPSQVEVVVRAAGQVVQTCTSPCVLSGLVPGPYVVEGTAAHFVKASVDVALRPGEEALANLECKPIVEPEREKRVLVTAQGGKLTSRDDGERRTYMVEHSSGTLKVTVEGHSPDWKVTAASSPYSRLKLDNKTYEQIVYVPLTPGRHILRPMAGEMGTVVFKLQLP